MAEHDPICKARLAGHDFVRCICAEVAEARADERRHMSALVDLYADRFTDLRAKVEALQAKSSGGGVRSGALQDVLDILDGVDGDDVDPSGRQPPRAAGAPSEKPGGIR